MYRQRFILTSLLLLLTACGGSGSSPEKKLIQPGASKSTADSEGRFTVPSSDEEFGGNLLVDIAVSDIDGLKDVSLSFNQQTQRHSLCNGTTACTGTQFATTVGGIFPGSYGISPGNITLGLWVTDQTDTDMLVSSVEVSWQPQQISAVVLKRSTDGTAIDVSWQSNPQLLRYNLYVAAQPGVNQASYVELDEGQAFLAIKDSQYLIEGLSPAKTYYILLAGIDGSGESAFTQEWTVQPGSNTNNSPVAQDDIEVISEDTQSAFTPLVNDSDPDGDALNLLSVNASSGQASINGQNVNYQPAINFNGQATITYVVSDPFGATDSAQIQVTINPVNDPPDVQDEAESTQDYNPINIDVLANDSDPDGDALSVISVSAANGTVMVENDNSITYEPDQGFLGEDTIDYEVSDGNGGSAQGIVFITVSSSNLAPIASDDAYPIYQNTILSIAKGSGLLINDSDPNNDVIVVDTQPVSSPSSGTLTLSSDGSFTYTPNNGFVGIDTFSYQISDPDLEIDTATVTINVQAVPGDLLGDSLNMIGEFLYIGLGETSPGSGIGTGLYRIGNCIQLIDTYCSMFGDYQESGGSGNQPGQTGSYAFTMTYSGTGNSPVVARSTTPGGNSLNFVNVGDALFELYLFPSSGGVIKSVFPDQSFSTLINFGAFITNQQVCQGLPLGQTCSIGNVGLTAGAVDTAPLDRLNFTVSGYATVDISSEPVALDDQYQLNSGQSLAIAAPGVLDNDSDADSPIVGDTLNVRSQVATALTVPVALAVDEYRQFIYVYDGFSSFISVFDRAGQTLDPVTWPGEGSNDADMDVAPVSFSMANTLIPQGSLLVFNGETAETEIYAIDPLANTQLAVLNTSFGNSHVVGGAFNPVTNTLFLLQDNVPGAALGNQVAEIDPNTGQVLSSFLINADSNLFNVGFGDIEVNSVTGSLYLVSSADTRMLELTTDGKFIRYVPLPAAITSPSGVALSSELDRVWLVNNSASSPVFEVAFANKGKFPGLISELITSTQNGSVTLNLDGSFTYTPNQGFSGQDSFVYQVSDQTGKVAQASVLLTVQ